MFFRMLIGTLWRQKRKMAMIGFTVALGISLATALMNVMFGVGDKINQELKVYGANISVVSKDASLLNDLYGLNEGDGIENKYLNELDAPKIKQIFWGFNILDFAPYLKFKATGLNNDKLQIYGTWFFHHLDLNTGESIDVGAKNMKTWWNIEGVFPVEDSVNQAVIGTILAQRNNLTIGDTLSIEYNDKQHDLKIVGILNAGGEEDEQVFVSLKEAQKISGLEGKISGIDVSALTTPDNELARKASQNPDSLTPTEYETWYCTAYVSSICYQIQEAVTDSVAKPIRQVANSEGTILNKTRLLMLLITILSSIGSALGISNLVTASVIERSQEIGLIKAIGAKDRRIVFLILSEIFATAFIGAFVGYIVGLGFAQIIGWTVFSSSIPIAVMVIPIDIILLFVVILLGSIPAVRYLLRLKPTEVLHGN